MTEPSDTRSKTFRDHVLREIKAMPQNHMKDIASELEGIIEAEWNSIPEPVFKQAFLSLFVEGIKGNEEAFQHWLNVAGNIRFGVHLHEEGDPSKRILTAPPLYDSSMFDPTAGREGDSITTHTVMFDAFLRNRPMQAMPYFQTKMIQALGEKLRNPTSRYWKMYAELLAYYGFDYKGAPMDQPKTVAQGQATPIVINGSDDVL